MPSKLKSVPMRTLLETLVKVGNFELVEFTEAEILHKDVADWPVVDCLLAFYSRGYPISRVIDYVKRVNPIVLNDLHNQYTLRNRRSVYERLTNAQIPTPRHLFVDHNAVREGRATLEEHEDYIVYGNERLNKPFIEKPEDADDHNNYVYYPTNAGGGCKKLFRKLANRSSEYYPHISTIRRDGLYIYEEFLPTLGTDIKVYTVGPVYAHAEARKSPTLDGRVQRTENGKEERYPVLLTEEEKEIALNVVDVFKQVVCGFDILRTTSGKAVVCDVNGWSFVKGNPKYYSDCAHILSSMFTRAHNNRKSCAHGRISNSSVLTSGYSDPRSTRNVCRYTHYKSCILDELNKEDLHNVTATSFNQNPNRATLDNNNSEATIENDPGVDDELQTIVVVMRHGDRSPKQKTKFLTADPDIVGLFKARQPQFATPYRRSRVVKLRTKQDLVEFGHAIQEILAKSGPSHPNYEDLQQINSLFADEDDIDLTRKVQLVVPKEAVLNSDRTPNEILVVVKWGGELTSLGLETSESLGHDLREKLYPGEKDGLLRLHSTFRHDFKIYTSDEGRCQLTAASFTKGFLDLDGELPPILVQMVSREEKAQEIFEESQYTHTTKKCKAFIQAIIQTDLFPKDLCQQYFQPLFLGVECPLCFPDSVPVQNPFQSSNYFNPDPASQEFPSGSSSTTSFTPVQIGLGPSPHTFPTLGGKSVAPEENLPLDPATVWVWQALLARYHSALELIGPMRPRLESIDQSISKLLEKIQVCLDEMELREEDLTYDLKSTRKKLQGIHRRWALLSQAWKRNGVFDATKVPEVFDNAQFDTLHGHTYLHYAQADRYIRDIFANAGRIGPLVSALEFGINPNEKVEIGCKSVPRLLRKINDDLTYQHARFGDDTASNPTGSTTAEVGPSFQRQVSREQQTKMGTLARHQSPDLIPSFGVRDTGETVPQHKSRSPSIDDDEEELLNTAKPLVFPRAEDVTPCGTPLDLHTEDEDGDHVVLKHEEARRMGIKSPWRKVRSRYYTASASHVMSLLNVLTYGQFVTWHLGGQSNGHQRVCSDVSGVTVLTQSDAPQPSPLFALNSVVAPLHISASDTPYLSRITMRVLRPPGRHGTVSLGELRVDLCWTCGLREPGSNDNGTASAHLSPHSSASRRAAALHPTEAVGGAHHSVKCTVAELCQVIRMSLNRLADSSRQAAPAPPTSIHSSLPTKGGTVLPLPPMNLEESA